MLTLLAAALVVLAAPPAPEPGTFAAAYDDALEWRCIGPSRGGRVTAVCGIPGDERTYYMGATGGGVWRTDDAGATWRPIADGQIATGSVGAIAVAPSDPNVIYVGMGERDPRGNFSHGDGVYRSVDAGRTWTHVGFGDSRHVARLAVHPRDEDTAWAAVLGHVWGPHEERGVYRTRDGGATWERLLFVDEQTGAIDLCLDPTNPRILFAATWHVRRRPWGFESGGPGSDLWRSRDGGDTWERLEKGLPEGVKGKIGVSVSAADPRRVYAMVEAEDGGLFRSDDGGDSWRRVNEDRSLRQRAWYYTHVRADPGDADVVYVLNVSLHRSEDGGRTFASIRAPHSDHHDLWIDPTDSSALINGNDGGANVSRDRGATWSRQDNQPTAQFYHVTVDSRTPYRVYGAQQDNSTVSISSRNFTRPGEDFHAVGGGESGFIAVRPDDPDIVYAGSYGGLLTRYDHAHRTVRNITVWPEDPMGAGAEAMKERFQWTFPIVLSPHDPGTLYACGHRVFRSRDEGSSWEAISPDLTTNDPAKLGPAGGPITKDNTSVEYYCTIFAFAESPHRPGELWAGSDDGLVHVSRDGGGSWTNVTPPTMAVDTLVSSIEISPHDPDAVLLAVNRQRLDDFAPRILRTRDGGRTWSELVAADAGIPDGAFVRAVREDPVRSGLLYAATETGMFVSFDDGARWQSLALNMPAVPITDCLVKDDDLVISTQGRSFWILRGLAPVRAWRGMPASDAAALVPPDAAIRGLDQATIWFALPETGRDEAPVALEIVAPDDAVVRRFAGRLPKAEATDGSATPAAERGPGGGEAGDDDEAPGTDRLEAKRGVNRFDWNLREADGKRVRGAVRWNGNVRGPQVVPGAYRVRLAIGGETLEAPLAIRADPRDDATLDDLARHHALLREIRGLSDRVADAINGLRTVREQVRAAERRAIRHAGKDGAAALSAEAKAILDELEIVEEALTQRRAKSGQDALNFPIRLDDKLAGLAQVVEGARGRPTAQSYAVLEDLAARIEPQLARWRAVADERLASFNAAYAALAVPAVMLEPDDS